MHVYAYIRGYKCAAVFTQVSSPPESGSSNFKEPRCLAFSAHLQKIRRHRSLPWLFTYCPQVFLLSIPIFL